VATIAIGDYMVIAWRYSICFAKVFPDVEQGMDWVSSSDCPLPTHHVVWMDDEQGTLLGRSSVRADNTRTRKWRADGDHSQECFAFGAGES
jgi:hypothetical protein